MPDVLEQSDLLSRGYLGIFFEDLENLFTALPSYRSTLLKLDIKPSEDPQDMLERITNENDRIKAITDCDWIRLSVERTYTKYDGMAMMITELKNDKLKKYYEEIIKYYAPPLDVVSAYTFEINRTFLKGTLEKTLKKMEVFYGQFSKG